MLSSHSEQPPPEFTPGVLWDRGLTEVSLKMSASSFWTFRERSSVPEASRAGEPSETPCQRLRLPKLHPLAPPSLARTRLPSENPADDSLLSDSSITDL